MTRQQLDILTQRLESLEYKVEQYRKTASRWRAIGYCTTAALVLILFIGATDQGGKIQEEIRASRIVLVDHTGKERMMLTGAPNLYFYDEKGNPVIAFETYAGPALTLASNKKSITMRIREVNYSGGSKGENLELSLDGARSSVLSYVHEGNDPGNVFSISGVTLSHKEKIAQDKEMRRTIGLFTSSARTTLSLTKVIDAYGSGPATSKALEQYFRTKDRAELELDEDGAGRLILKDGEGRSRAVLGSINLEQARVETVEKRPTSSLVLFGKDGKVLWNAP